MADISIRNASFADLGLLARMNVSAQGLHAQELPWLFKKEMNEREIAEVFRATLGDMSFFCKIADLDCKSAGYVVAEFWQKGETELKHAHSMVYVHQIGVLPDVRRKGVGTALMAAVKDEARESGVDLLTADVWSFNSVARDFFSGFGLVTYTEKMWARID